MPYGSKRKTEFVLCSPDLKYSLASGYYIGRIYLPKSRQEVNRYYGKNN